MKNQKIFVFVILILLGCKKPYNPAVVNAPETYLVVEGTINTNDTTTIKLSKTVNLSNEFTTNPVNNATLTIEGDDGSNYGMVQKSDGTYSVNAAMDNTRKYRLHIKTADNKEYVSDYEQAKISPPIDSIGFVATSKKLQLYVNSHDPKNSTRYYRFDYAETWMFHSKYNSEYISNGTEIVPRTHDQGIYYCFADDRSSSIVLGSTAKLSQDVLYQAPLTEVAPTSEKIGIKYSILVHQYALTEDAYKFWDNLKKNTEQLGSIFDAQPSQISGNIHNTRDPSEIVVGYISAGTVSSKRIFIASEQLPPTYSAVYPYECTLDSLWYANPKTHTNQVAESLLTGGAIPVYAFYNGGATPLGFLSSSNYCVDCTVRGRTRQPDFWK